jgi:uncharacterized protein YbaR (Trm112 family)
VSQRRKQPATSTVPNDIIEKIIHLHDVEHKGFRKVADELGMTKDRVHRIYKKDAAAFKKQRQKMFSQDPVYMALKKTEQEIERKKIRDLAIEETKQKIKDHQMQRAQTSKGLEEIFSDQKEMVEFAEHTVKQYEALKLFCRERKLEPEKTLVDLIGSKEDYVNTAEEEGEVQDLPEYIGSTIDSFLMSRKEEEEKQLLVRKFFESISKTECQNCNSNRIIKFIIVEDELVCTNCNTHYDMLCPRCKTKLSVNAVDVNTTEYRCPSCKLAFQNP